MLLQRIVSLSELKKFLTHQNKGHSEKLEAFLESLAQKYGVSVTYIKDRINIRKIEHNLGYSGYKNLTVDQQDRLFLSINDALVKRRELDQIGNFEIKKIRERKDRYESPRPNPQVSSYAPNPPAKKGRQEFKLENNFISPEMASQRYLKIQDLAKPQDQKGTQPNFDILG